ncbi:MAG: PAS domain-containing protein [Nitrosomonadaceae bacterium]|nr:PAS domain-containing protein [Nitrosomonadaceae bacterium]
MIKRYVVGFLLTLMLVLATPQVSATTNTTTNLPPTTTRVEPAPGLLKEGFSLLMRISLEEWGIIFSALSSIGVGAHRYGWKPLRKVYLQLTKIINDHDDLSNKINRLYVEMTPNGGSSLCDSVRRMEVGIAKVETRHRAFLDSLRVIRFEADAQGDCLWVSSAYCELTGATNLNALGTGWTNILHPDDKELVLKEWASAVAGKRDFIQIYRIINLHDQSEHKVRCQASPLLNPRTKAVEGFVGTLYPMAGEFFEKYKNKGYIW